MEIEKSGSLLTVKGTDQCLGYLLVIVDRGTYDADHGRTNVSPEDAAEHNKVLDKMVLDGLDKNCEVGQYGTFYIGKTEAGKACVKTWMGALVSADVVMTPFVRRNGRFSVITFRRNGKVFRGTHNCDMDVFKFRRIS
jgi:hypothetical protein